LSNLLLNAVAGILLVSMTLVQIGGGMSAQGAGLLTLGYAIAIVAFIRVGEKLLQRLGPRKPMVWGSLIVGASVLLLTPTYTLLDTYKILAIVAFTLIGIGLASTPRHPRMPRSRMSRTTRLALDRASTRWPPRLPRPSAWRFRARSSRL